MHCRRGLTSLGMCPWYQPWLLMSVALSLSSSSSSLRSFSGGDSSRYFSLENWRERKGHYRSSFFCSEIQFSCCNFEANHEVALQ